jgi:hypothetical protein
LIERQGASRTQLMRFLPLLRKERQVLVNIRKDILRAFQDQAAAVTVFGSVAHKQDVAGSDLDVLILAFHAGAEAAKAFEYWNAAGVLIIHAAIACTDAITIRIGGAKSQGDDHMAAVDLLRQVIALDKDGHKAVNHLWRMIQKKNVVSYQGEIYKGQRVEQLWKRVSSVGQDYLVNSRQASTGLAGTGNNRTASAVATR